MIDWTGPKTEPPLTMDLTDLEILEIIEKPLFLPPFPCHTLDVERLVPVVTESALHRIGPVNRHRQYITQQYFLVLILEVYHINYFRWIVQTLKSRELCSKMSSKKDDTSME